MQAQLDEETYWLIVYGGLEGWYGRGRGRDGGSLRYLNRTGWHTEDT